MCLLNFLKRKIILYMYVWNFISNPVIYILQKTIVICWSSFHKINDFYIIF